MKRLYLVYSLSLLMLGLANAQPTPTPKADARQTNAVNTAHNSGGQVRNQLMVKGQTK